MTNEDKNKIALLLLMILFVAEVIISVIVS